MSVFDELLRKFEAPSEEMPKPDKKLEILVIDDDESIRRGLNTVLSYRYNVITAENGTRGLQLLTPSIHCVILDVKMKELNGFSIYPKLKNKCPNVPIIFFTAFQSEHDLQAVINKHKPEGYVEKGDDISLLENLIQNAVNKYCLILENESYKRDLEKKVEKRTKDLAETHKALIMEIHHRVKNNMQIVNSLLHLQSLRSNDKKVISILAGCRNRINAIALVHEKLYQSDQLSKINTGRYIRDLGKHLFQSYNENTGTVSFKREIAEIHLPIERAIPVGLILNELITNAIKYAFPDGRAGEIFIKFSPITGDEVQLTFRDNGIGISKEKLSGNGKSLGLTLVRTLAEKQLKGKLYIDNDQGTQYRIRFFNT